MTLQSSETTPLPPKPHSLDDGPVLACAPGADAADPGHQLLQIRARRFYPVSREELFATWIGQTGWDSWMRLRARSRSTLAPYRGGAFRLELGDGPTIHVITGDVSELRSPEFLSFSWLHESSSDHGSTLDVTFREHNGQSELILLHRSITSRREAAWLMRLWAAVLARLGAYLQEGSPTSHRVREIVRRIPLMAEPEARSAASSRFARSA